MGHAVGGCALGRVVSFAHRESVACPIRVRLAAARELAC